MVYLFSYIISILTLELNIDLFFNGLFSKKNKLILVIVSLLACFSFLLIAVSKSHTILIFPYHYLLLTALIIYGFYLGSHKKKLGFEQILLFFLIENIFFLYLLDLTSLAWANTSLFLYWPLLNLPFQILLTKIFKYIYERFDMYIFGDKIKSWCILILLWLFLLCQIVLMMPINGSSSNQVVESPPHNTQLVKFSQKEIFQSNKVFIIFIAFTILTIFFVTVEIKRNRKSKKMQHDKKMMEAYIDTLEKMQLDIQKVQHDYKNMLIGINGFIEDEQQVNISKLKIFLGKNKLIQNDVNIRTGTFMQLKNINILEVKGLISTKVAQAIQSGIHVSIECQETINITRVDSLVLSRILGIMMDNAIEACSEIDHSEIRLAFLDEQKRTIIILANTCQERSLSISSISKYGVSDKGDNRGFGLGNLRQLTESHPNLTLETTCENYWFTQRLFIGK